MAPSAFERCAGGPPGGRIAGKDRRARSAGLASWQGSTWKALRTLAPAVGGLVEAGIVEAQAGKLRLLPPDKLPGDWDPARDRRLTVWEACHHLVRAYWVEQRGEEATAALLASLGPDGHLARELAYRLFAIAERKKRGRDAQGYNALVVGWQRLEELAAEIRSRQAAQGRLGL